MRLASSLRSGLPRAPLVGQASPAITRRAALHSAQPRHFRGSRSTAAERMSTMASKTETPNSTYQYDQIKDVKVWLASEQKEIEVKSLFSEQDRTVMVFARELASECAQKVIPKLDEQGIKLWLVSIGPPPRGLEFSKLTGFPAERLLADPENETYSKLPFKQGALATFFSPKTPISIWQRIQKDGASALKEILPKTKLWIPGNGGLQAYKQSTQQGGTLVFKGTNCTWAYYDEATAAHATSDQIIDNALAA